jgi:arylsulfatase A-like enzyme
MIKFVSEDPETFSMSFWKYFRLIFVIFSLYLLGDAFFRWDGFAYYAPFSEFMLSVALASILWSCVAVFTAFFVWGMLSLYDRLAVSAGLRYLGVHVLFLLGTFLLLGVLVWKGKKVFWPDIQTTVAVKSAVFLSVSLVSVFLTRASHASAERLMNVIQHHITPLVWGFGIFVVVSIPFVGYHAFFKGAGGAVPVRTAEITETRSQLPNIILVTFDALTARNMSLYGYERDTTPFMKKWAQNAVVFNRVEAASNFTTSATASIMTGKRVWNHRTFQIEGTPVKGDTESLPAVLKKNGYYNLAFIVNPHTSVDILGMADSFDVAPNAVEFSKSASLVGLHFGYLEVFLSRLFGNKIKLHKWVLKNDFVLGKVLRMISGDFSTTTIPPEITFKRFIHEADTELPRPFFAWIHVLPPHDPYLPPDAFKRQFTALNKLRSFKAQQNIKDESYKYLFDYMMIPEHMQPDVELMKHYYDEFIRYCDKQFERFVNMLQERNMLDETVLVLSSDHGESFEHGYFTHGGPFLYEQVTHIPLIIKEPGRGTGQVIDGLVEQVDIPATILDFADINVPSWMDGRSLIPLLRGNKLSARPAFSMNFEENPSRGNIISRGSIAVWSGEYKLIHYMRRNESILFNINKDPDEKTDLLKNEPETAKRLLSVLLGNLRDANKRIRNSNK